MRAPVRPTLAAVMDWGREAEGISDGIVDIALLDARLEAEGIGSTTDGDPRSRARRLARWSMARGPRGRDVLRPVGLTFDLDGVAKGWLADRAVRAAGRLPISRRRRGRRHRDQARAGPADGGSAWPTRATPERSRRPRAARTDARESPRRSGSRRPARASIDGRSQAGPSHHLIDPRTGRPARTDLVQATILAGSAREAEAIAKTAVIIGSESALERLDRAGVHAGDPPHRSRETCS